MSISQTIRSRTGTKPIADDPDTLHGLLMLREAGNDMSVMAGLAGVRPGSLVRILNRAAAGEVRRVPAYLGNGLMVSAEDAPAPWHGMESGRIDGSSFTKKWHRVAIEAMLRPNGIGTRDLSNLLSEAGMSDDMPNLMQRLRQSMGQRGLTFTKRSAAHGNQFVYKIEGDSARRLRAVVANDWRDLVDA